MKTKMKALIFALLLSVIICALTLEASAAKLEAKQLDIMETLKRQMYSEETLFEKSFVLRGFLEGEFVHINIKASDPRNIIPVCFISDAYDGTIDRRQHLFTCYTSKFVGEAFTWYDDFEPDKVFRDIVMGKSKLHTSILSSKSSKRTIGFLKAADGLYPLELSRDKKNKLQVDPGIITFQNWHMHEVSIDSFFAREDVRNELVSSSLDLPNTKVMLLYQFPLFWGIELLFYDENSEFIMFMADRELKLQHIRSGRAPFEGEKVDKFYHEAKLYPVHEILTDTQDVFDARPSSTGNTYP